MFCSDSIAIRDCRVLKISHKSRPQVMAAFLFDQRVKFIESVLKKNQDYPCPITYLVNYSYSKIWHLPLTPTRPGEGLGGDRPIHTIDNMCVSDQFFWDQTLIMNCVTLIRNHEMSCMLKQKFKFKFFNDSISTYLPCIIIFQTSPITTFSHDITRK